MIFKFWHPCLYNNCNLIFKEVIILKQWNISLKKKRKKNQFKVTLQQMNTIFQTPKWFDLWKHTLARFQGMELVEMLSCWCRTLTICICPSPLGHPYPLLKGNSYMWFLRVKQLPDLMELIEETESSIRKAQMLRVRLGKWVVKNLRDKKIFRMCENNFQSSSTMSILEIVMWHSVR